MSKCQLSAVYFTALLKKCLLLKLERVKGCRQFNNKVILKLTLTDTFFGRFNSGETNTNSVRTLKYWI